MANLLFNQFDGNSYSSYYGDINPSINKELNFNRNRLTNVGDPVDNNDVVNLKILKENTLSYSKKYNFSVNIHGNFSYREAFTYSIADNERNKYFETGHSFILLNYTSTIYHSDKLPYGCNMWLTLLRDKDSGKVLQHYSNYKADTPETVSVSKYIIPNSWGAGESYFSTSSVGFLFFSAISIQSGSATAYLSTSGWYQYIDIF